MTTGNKRGRPPKGDGPRLDYLELDRLLVEGELVVHTDGHAEREPEQSGVIDVTLVSDSNAESDAAPIPEDVSPDDAT
jgi:hypothetical protein